jgi:DNA invertase Pin-like site-specific DNA recombinase
LWLNLNVRTLIYVRQFSTQSETEAKLLRRSVEGRGDAVVATFTDDPSISGKGKYAGWRALVARLDDTDQVVVGSVADLPGQKAAHLFKILAMLNDHGVGLCLDHEGIDTDDGATAILGLVAAYRAAKLSDAIRHGQAKALAQGRKPGRPPVPSRIQEQIRTALARGAGIRPTARRFDVSPASVVNIRRAMSPSLPIAA